jgi:ribosomal protein L7/L12
MNDLVIATAIFGAVIALLYIRLRGVEQQLRRLSRLDAKVDALLSHAGVEFDSYHDVPADVREALERGETVLAIKRFRQATGVGLKEAKTFVEEVRRRRLYGSRF